MLNIITITTDFGLGEYVAAQKGVILAINPKATIVDISHLIRAQSIKEGAYVMYSTIPYFPPCINVGVVDPGVGTDRVGLVIECQKGFLVGPDNGLLLPSARMLGLKKVYKITNKQFMLKTQSATFWGRDVFAPVAAHLSLGIKPKEIGKEFEDFVDLTLESWKEEKGTLLGEALTHDVFGNIIFSIPKKILLKQAKFEDEIHVTLGNKSKQVKKKMTLYPSYAFAEPGEMLATVSSSGFLEIAVNLGSAVNDLKLEPISWVRISP